MECKENMRTVVATLRSFHAADREERPMDTFLRWIEDPLKPKIGEGNFRVNPILLLLAALAVLAGGTFLFFSLVQS
jgi:hypothetical protein